MSVWGVLRVLGRRFYIVIPLLVLGCVYAYMQGQKIQPVYDAQAYVTLVGPTEVTQPVPGQVGQTQQVPVNPLLNAGSSTLAAIGVQLELVEMSSKTQSDAIKAGVSPAYTVTAQSKSPTMVIESKTKSRALSLATVQFGINHLTATLEASEKGFINKPTERITMQTLIAPEIVSAKASKLRTELIYAAAGAVGGVVLALLVEALAIGRRRRAEAKRAASRPSRKAVSTAPDASGQIDDFNEAAIIRSPESTVVSSGHD